jgi:hypothetical protein
MHGLPDTSMEKKTDFRQTLTSEKLKNVFDTWESLRAGRIGPKREEITPAPLKGVLASTFIIDVVDGGQDFRFRFAGDRIIQFMGRRFAGMLLSELTGTAFFDNMRAMYAGCVAAKAPIASGVSQATYPGKDFLEIEAMVLPLSEDGANVTHLFGAFDSWQLGTHLAGR